MGILTDTIRNERAVTETEGHWDIMPVIVESERRWILFKIHNDGRQKFRDNHGHFPSLEAAQAAIEHLELPPVRIPAKGAE